MSANSEPPSNCTCYWYEGVARSGRTTALLEELMHWPAQDALLFAASGDLRLELQTRLQGLGLGDRPIRTTTPIGFIQEEVELYWPLITQQLGLTARWPLRLRPETEQELATRLWQPRLESGELALVGVKPYFVVRRTLDLMLLVALEGLPLDDVAERLEPGLVELAPGWGLQVQAALEQWRNYCWQRGLLSYGLAADLFSQVLLPLPQYQKQLVERYTLLLADDVDEYPALLAHLFEGCRSGGCSIRLSFNPQGGVRAARGADPAAFLRLKTQAQVILLPPPPSLGTPWGTTLVTLLSSEDWWAGELKALHAAPFRTLETLSRAQLLRQVVVAVERILSQAEGSPGEIAILLPGLDAIARYTLLTLLRHRQIPVRLLAEQRSLNQSAWVRALLTLLSLIYPNLGLLLGRDQVAEMLSVLTQGDHGNGIDPVRAGLLADVCYVPHPQQPQLLPYQAFPRWDRLGAIAATAYEQLQLWMTDLQAQSLPTPPEVLAGAIARWALARPRPMAHASVSPELPPEELRALRALAEALDHFWQVQQRIGITDPSQQLAEFIQVLRQGTVTADPAPENRWIPAPPAVCIATLYQYRTAHLQHRWQFWIDAGSDLWLKSQPAFFGGSLLLSSDQGQPLTVARLTQEERQRLYTCLEDLLSRCQQQVIFCHSELSLSGQEQFGPLLPVIQGLAPLV
jgi:hypothetical protein